MKELFSSKILKTLTILGVLVLSGCDDPTPQEVQQQQSLDAEKDHDLAKSELLAREVKDRFVGAVITTNIPMNEGHHYIIFKDTVTGCMYINFGYYNEAGYNLVENSCKKDSNQ